MKTRRWGKTILALAMALIMLLSCGMSAVADDPYGKSEVHGTGESKKEGQNVQWDENDGVAVYAYSNAHSGGTTSLTVNSSIVNDQEDRRAALNISLEDGTATVDTGAVTQKKVAENNVAVGITMKGNSTLNMSTGDITSDVTGLNINNINDNDHISGTIEKAETGDIIAEGTGVFINNEGNATVKTANITADNKGIKIDNKGTVNLTTGDIDSKKTNEIINHSGTATITTTNITSGGEGLEITNYAGNVTATTGAISAKDIGVDIKTGETYEDVTTGSNTVTINGPITVKASESNTVAEGDAAYQNNNSTVGISVIDTNGFTNTVTANGNITVTGNEASGNNGNYACGIMVETDGNATITTNDSNIAVSGQSACGVSLQSLGNNTEAEAADSKPSTITATLDGEIMVTGESVATGAYLLSSDSGNLKATITGDTITATVDNAESEEEANSESEETTRATALSLENHCGTMDVSVEADLVAKGADISTGVVIESTGEEIWRTTTETKRFDSEVEFEARKTINIFGDQREAVCVDGQWYINTRGSTYMKVTMVEELTSSTNLTITGNVTAEQVGLDLEIADGQEANIVVDGTVFGNDAGIVLRDETEIGDNLKLTVWEVTPNDKGAVIFREEKDEKGNITYKEDEEAEKLLQYIIKIEDKSADYITTSGTRDFEAGNGEKYQVANEGDTVLVKLTIPEGKELVGAYWDEEQTEKGQLLVDPETGDYYVEVPRGGGVILSVVLKDIEPEPEPEPKPKPEPKPEPQPGPAPTAGESETGTTTQSTVSTLLTLYDKTNEMSIILYSNGTYKAVLSNKQVDYGTFATENDHITLTSKTGKTIEVARDGSNWKLTFSGEGDKTYEFAISAEEMQGLIDALKK